MNTGLFRISFKDNMNWICGGRVYSEGLGFGTVIGYRHGEIDSRVYIKFDDGEKRSVKASTGFGMHNDDVFYVDPLPKPAGWAEILWPTVWFAVGLVIGAVGLTGGA